VNIEIGNVQQILSHVLLDNKSLSRAVASTEEWRSLGEIRGTILYNGIEVSAESLETSLKGVIVRVESYYREQYHADRFDKAVEEKAEAILKEHADNALNKIRDLAVKLEEADTLLVPHWERNK
jgi:hypothetical protein